jgi:perosamine synthetase
LNISRPPSVNTRPTDEKRGIIGIGTFTATLRAKQLVMSALDNGRLSYGPMTQRFEADFAKLHGCRFGIMSNSGTSALQLALQAMKELHGWADGDEVIIPAVTFVATANIVLHNRMTPTLVDVDSKYYEINPDIIEPAITPRTRAIIPVHLFGQPADMDPITEIARKYSLKIIEDSAETMFASYKGRRVGGLGDVGCFSTYVAHLLVTGVGGINTTNEPDYAIRIRSLLNHGRDSIYLSMDDDNNKSAEELRTIVERRFKFNSIGHSFRVTEMEAAIGLAQIDDWQPVIAKRRRNAAFLTQALTKFNDHLQTPKIRPNCEHSFMMYPLVTHGQAKCQLVNYLEESGIETRDMLPLTNQPIHQRLLGWRENDFPIAQKINNNGFYIGCHQDLSDIELEYVVECVDRFFHRVAMRKSDGVALALLADHNTRADKIVLDALPTELFAQTVVIDSGMPTQVRAEFEQRDVTIIQAQHKDPLDVIAATGDVLKPDAVVIFPCNGQWNPKDISPILVGLHHGYDMVIASRFMMGGERQGQHGNIRSLGNRVFNLLANVLFASNLSDGFSSFRAVRRSKLAEVSPPGRGLAKFYALSIEAVKRDWRIREIPAIEVTRSTRQVIGDSVSNVFPALLILGKQWRSQRAQQEARHK